MRPTFVLMAQPQPAAGAEPDRPRAALVPQPTGVPELSPDVRPLGEALGARAAEVSALTSARFGPSDVVDAAVGSRYKQINQISTLALARWLAGDGPEGARQVSGDTWRFYGDLAAQRAVSLKKVTLRTLWWRDAVAEVLRRSAAELNVSSQALSQALQVLQYCTELGLVRMATSFDSEHQRTDEELAFMATHDALTGLPNRTLVLDRVQQMLARAARNHTRVAALLLEIDNLKTVTDTLGHDAGEELLKAVAARLDGAVRGADALGCFGGGTFVVICEDVALSADADPTAARILEALTPVFTLGAQEETRVSVSSSIGIAVGEHTSPEQLLHQADIAMHRAKWDGENCCVVFEPGMQDAVQSQMELERDLRDALPNNEFFLVYQPTFSLRDLKPTGVEALIRWRHPTRDIVGPNEFIPLLEETGLIIDVGQWVLEEACRQAATWRRAGHPIGIAVNVSARQLDRDEFVTVVRNALSNSGLDASALTLEITETSLMRNVEATVQRLTAIKQLGVRVAIDDFGTGYSSLAHLQRLPVDSPKIDRSFISRLTQDAEGEAVIHTLVQLGKALSIETLAEGIEEPQELSMLQHQRCDSGQGFSTPGPSTRPPPRRSCRPTPRTARTSSPRSPRTSPRPTRGTRQVQAQHQLWSSCLARWPPHARGRCCSRRMLVSCLARSLERRLDLGSEQIEVQTIGIVRLERMEPKPLPPRLRILVQGGDDNDAAGRLLVELDGCGEDMRREGGPNAEVGVAAVDSQPAEQESRNGVWGPLGDHFRGSRPIDAGHRHACVCHDEVVGVGDDPRCGGVTASVLPGVAAQPLVEDRFSAVEPLAVVSARVQQRRPAELNQAS